MTLYGWTYCRSCHAKIFWLKNEKTGKLAPIDAAPSQDGNIEIEAGKGIYHVVGKLERSQTPDYPYRHTSHFVTCPAAGAWKRHGGSGSAQRMRGPRSTYRSTKKGE